MRRHLSLLVIALLGVAACGSGGSDTAEAPEPSDPTVPAATASPPPATSAIADPPVGTWRGALSDPTGSYEARFLLAPCSVDQVCGELEYFDPMQPEFVLCAPQLLYTGIEAAQFVFEEQPAYRADQCFPTTLRLRYVDADTVAVDQYGEPGKVCCTGEFDKVSDEAPPPTQAPVDASLAGLDGPLSVTDLGGPTTQYVGVNDDAIWFPVNGAVHRIDPATGQIVATIAVGDAEDGFGDPHAVTAVGDEVWVAVAADRAVARIEPATNTVVETIPLDVIPYALALDGNDLWVTSFENDAVVRVDVEAAVATARVDAMKPTGVAVGGGSVWVVQHRDDTLVRIDPASNTVAETIVVGSTGDDPECGICVENVVYAFDAVWTANNAGHSISRIDPATGAVDEIELAHRAWAVAADSDSIWASQYEPLGGGRVDTDQAGLAHIDPNTYQVEQLALHGAMSVASGHGSVWAVVLGPRSDHVYRYAGA